MAVNQYYGFNSQIFDDQQCWAFVHPPVDDAWYFGAGTVCSHPSPAPLGCNFLTVNLSSLYIVDDRILSDIQFHNSFVHTQAFLSFFFIALFVGKNVFSLMKSHLLLFSVLQLSLFRKYDIQSKQCHEAGCICQYVQFNSYGALSCVCPFFLQSSLWEQNLSLFISILLFLQVEPRCIKSSCLSCTLWNCFCIYIKSKSMLFALLICSSPQC